MKRLIRKSLRDLWQDRHRAVVSLVAIVLGLTAFGLVAAVNAIIRRELPALYEATNPASATVVVDRADDALRALTEDFDGIAGFEVKAYHMLRVQAGDEWKTLELFAAGSFEFNRTTPVAGALEPGPGEALIETDAEAVARATAGDTVALQLPDGSARSLVLAGSLNDLSVHPASIHDTVYLYVGLDTLEALGLAPNRIDFQVDGATYDRDHIVEVADRYTRLLAAHGYTVQKVEIAAEPGVSPHAGEYTGALFLLQVVAIVSFLFGALIMANLLASLLAGQIRQIGVLKAVGGQTRQIMAGYLVALLVTVAAGAALALPLVAATSGAVARGLLGLGNMTPRSTAAPAWLYALIAGLGLVVPLLVALIPLRHGLCVSVRTALNDYGVDLGATAGRPPRAVGRLSRPVLLSLRNALRRKGRLALNLTLLTASGIMFTTVVTAMLSVDQSLDDNLAAFRYDYSIAIDPRTDPADLAKAVAAAGTVEDYEVWRGTTAELMGADGRAQASYPVIAPAEASRMIEPDLEAGRWIAPGDTDAIVVSHRFLTAQPDYQVGGRLGLRLGGAVHTFTIVGAISDFSEAALYLDPGRFDDLVPADAASATVRLVTASAQNRTRHYAAIDAAFAAAGVPVQRSASQADVQEIFASHYLVTLRTFLFVIVLIVAVAGFGLAATMNVQAFERTREVGVMKALGGGARQIKRIVTAEAVFVGLIACALTAVLGVGASWAGLQVFGAQVMRVDLDFRPLTYGLCCLMWLALTLLVGYAASRNAARRAAGTPIRTALSYDQ